jgi:hypothetical protein
MKCLPYPPLEAHLCCTVAQDDTEAEFTSFYIWGIASSSETA